MSELPIPHPVVIELVDRSCGLEGWIAVHSVRGGLAFGGTRIAPEVDAATVGELARVMTWKLAAHGLPTGGAKGGIRSAPDAPGLTGRLRRFGELARGLLRDTVALGKDMGATQAHLDAIYAGAGVGQLHLAGCVAPGPQRLFELPGYRPFMTGQGVAWGARAAVGGSLAGVAVAVQGFGAVGRGSAVRLAELGARVVAISDADGAWQNDAGWSRDALAGGASSPGRLPGASSLGPRDGLLSRPVDVLVLAAASRSVDAALAASVEARVVVEGANFALTDGARAALHARGVLVVPDAVASSSSAALVAHQLASRCTLPPDAVWSSIEASITGAVASCTAAARRSGRTLREEYVRRYVPEPLQGGYGSVSPEGGSTP